MNQGKVVQIIGAVVDVEFPRESVPKVYDALTIAGTEITLEVQQQLGDGMLYFETHDFRACLVYALDSELILLGTTDIRDEAPDDPACSKEEIDYLFKVLDEVLPGSNAREDEIVFAYAGIRPLPWSGASATGAISRDHALHVFDADSTRPFPVMTLVGGKWTTYRACAEQITLTWPASCATAAVVAQSAASATRCRVVMLLISKNE